MTHKCECCENDAVIVEHNVRFICAECWLKRAHAEISVIKKQKGKKYGYQRA
jgi:hypothetical protein